MFDEEFRKQNADLFLSEDVPEDIKNAYYKKILTILEFSDNLKYFEGKKISQAFDFSYDRNWIDLYGEDIYQLFSNYKPIMDKIKKDVYILLPTFGLSGERAKEKRKEIMATTISEYFIRNGCEKLQSWQELKMVQDFISLENLPLTPNTREFLEKYGIDRIIESGLDIKYLMTNEKLTNLQEISNLKEIEPEDIKKLVNKNNRKILDRYSVKQLLQYGIQDFNELLEPIMDFQQIKTILEKRPADLINIGKYTDMNIEFIKKYGIDNIIALDEETNGMFSHPMWANDMYLTFFAIAERRIPELKKDKQLTYDEFRDRMYEILLHSRDKGGPLKSRAYPDYDFIQGKFREEHPEIFIDGDIDPKIKEEFYTGHMSAEDVRNNPKLIQLLQGKDLSRVFPKTMSAGISLQMTDKDGDIIGGIPNIVNMAQYLSERIGQEEFLKICADYGKCLDNIGISTKNEITIESIRNLIEDEIYKNIKEKGFRYFVDLPLSFQEKHPELFLPKEIDEDIRKRFCEGKLSYEDVRKNPQIKDVLLTKDISVGFAKKKYGYHAEERYTTIMWRELSEQEIINFAEKYGKFIDDIDPFIFEEGQSESEREEVIQRNIEKYILDRIYPYDETIPEFFKKKYPEMFLDEKAPQALKELFYDEEKDGLHKYETSVNVVKLELSFILLYYHPEWKEFLKGKNLSRAFPAKYNELFKRFDSSTLMRLGTRNPETIEKMVQNHKEDILEKWYKSTGGKFVPHHVVMLNFPEGEIDSFFSNSKKWSQLMRIDNYNLNDDGKAAILKASYAMGVFQGNDDGFNKTMKLFTDVPQELSQEEYKKVTSLFNGAFAPFRWSGNHRDPHQKDEEMKSLFEQAYTLNDDGKYVFSMDKQKNKDSVRMVREILEKAQIPRILTPEKAHQMFDSFAMEYNPDFVRFFNDNIEEILSNPEYTKDIATIQRQFKDIVRTNAGRRLTLVVAQDYIKSIVYTDIEVGNEGVAEQAKIAGYSQKDFEAIQSLFNEGEVRDYSSIPRIQGKTNGYTYEMLRCDDPLALTIGTLTDCCQEIHGAGQTSMEHSVVSPDGRVFCVRDAEGRLVAQSWFWRNQYTGCFDNIEIPHRIFELYEKEHPDVGRKGLTSDVLEVYKKAAQDLMHEDARVYQELLENGTITQEQYDALLLGKVTIGLGYNDIADAIQADKTIHEETDNVEVKSTDRLPYPYTDASTQYTIAERYGIIKSKHENLYVHQDDVPIFDGTNMSSTVLLTMKRMEQSTKRDNLAYVSEKSDEENLPKSQKIINNIAREYGLDPDITKVMATARIALIYSKDKDEIKIGDILSSPIKTELSQEQKQKLQSHVKYQLKKALKQIGIQDSDVDLSLLDEEQQQMLQSIIQEIEKENGKRGER